MNDLKLIRRTENAEIIYGEDTYFRPIVYDDTPLIVKWRNEPQVMHNFVFQEKFTNEMHNKWLETKVQSGEVVQYIIVSNFFTKFPT